MLQNDEGELPIQDKSLENIRDMQQKLIKLKLSDPFKRVDFRSGELKQNLSQSQVNPVYNQPNMNPIPDEQMKSSIPIKNFYGSQSAIFSSGQKINSLSMSQVFGPQVPSSRNKLQQPKPQQNQIEFNPDELQDEDKILCLNDNLEQKNHDQQNKELDLKLVPLQTHIQMKNNNVQKLLAMISIRAEDALQTKEIPKVGVDLICLIDRSGSMEGKKMETVKQCLDELLEFLSEKDRLCLIIFNSSSQRLCSFKSCSQENKIKLKRIIQKINATGDTDIGSSTQLAIEQIKVRQYKNKVTSVFLLSDGQDNKAFTNVKKQLDQVDDPFTIHSFGFGSDHDANMMSNICSLRNGAFYFVNEISLLDEYFVNALGSLVGVFYDKINIRLEVMPNDFIQNVSIYKTYGNMWKPIEINKIYNIDLQQIAQGQRKDYLFKLQFTQLAQISDSQRQQQIIKAIIKMRNINTNQIIEQQVNLQLQFYNVNEQIPILEIKEKELEIQYYRVKSANVIQKANQLCQTEQYQEAQKILQDLIEKINNNNNISDRLIEIVEDLKQAVEATKPYTYSNVGSKQMSQICSNNLNQAGQNSRFDRNLIQLSQSVRGMFDSQAQDMMRVSLMARKSHI